MKAGARSAGFTLVEVLVTMLIVMTTVALTGGAFVSVQVGTQQTERRDQAHGLTLQVMAKARQVEYSDLGFYASDALAPSGRVDLPLSPTEDGKVVGTTITEQAVVLGASRPTGTRAFTEAPVHTYTERSFDYKVTTWVTQVPPIAPDTVSRSKRVTIQTEWAPTGTPLTGACTGATSCSVQTMSRAAAGSDVDPTTGGSAHTSSACQITAASVCETYVRSGRVLDGARMATGTDLPTQSEAVDLYARTNQVAQSVTATWSYTVATGNGTTAIKNVSKALTSTDGGTRWFATVDPDPVKAGTVPKGDIRPGTVPVTFTAKVSGTTVTSQAQAFWSYTVATGAESDHIGASVQSVTTTWCSPAGAKTPVEVAVTGHTVGLVTGPVPTSSADTVSVVFTVPDAAGARTVTVPATLVSATPRFTSVNGTELPSSTDAVWRVTPPSTTSCALTSNASVVVHRAADASDTVVPVRLALP